MGDALGAPVEFLSWDQIRAQFGAAGIEHYAPCWGRSGAITDDTQMTLFTAEGLLCALQASNNWPGRDTFRHHLSAAYLRWLITQGGVPALQAPEIDQGQLVHVPALRSRRAPGMTCLSALGAVRALGQLAENNSKGCGGVMRVAPVGLVMGLMPDKGENWHRQTFELGADAAAITHGHPTGHLAAGALALIIALLVRNTPLDDAIEVAKTVLSCFDGHVETKQAIETAKQLAQSDPASPASIEAIGGGWIAEEALAISLFCALSEPEVETSLRLAVNHGGDSDSTGAITGNILGVIHGVDALPEWGRRDLELADRVAQCARDLHRAGSSRPY